LKEILFKLYFVTGSTSTLETGGTFSLDEDLASQIQHLTTEVGVTYLLSWQCTVT
jgi:hypothetical protein